MKQKLSKKAIYWLGVIAVGIALGLALQFVRAWTEPSAAPPGGNLGAPLNTGVSAQTKAGNLNVQGGMQIGNPTNGNMGTGTINAERVCIQGVCNSAWPSGGGGGGGSSCATCTCSSGGCYGCNPQTGGDICECGFSYWNMNNCNGCNPVLYYQYTCNNGIWVVTGSGACSTNGCPI
jgi:hypothetical protein